jgi:hypothetical protein
MGTCNRCGWVMFDVTREQAETEVAKFNEYFWSAARTIRDSYGGPSHISHYEYCALCRNSYKDFRETKPGDCPDGCTLNPIIKE